VTAEARFAVLVEAFAGGDGVTLGGGQGGFGAGTLQVNGRIFAMVSGGRLVLKLPAQRVAALVASGEGLPFDAGKGRPMREWVAFDERQGDHWLHLAEEARAFVAGRRGG
jgi:TfoX/Sxy family transcriptional regulator of competence genes